MHLAESFSVLACSRRSFLGFRVPLNSLCGWMSPCSSTCCALCDRFQWIRVSETDSEWLVKKGLWQALVTLQIRAAVLQFTLGAPLKYLTCCSTALPAEHTSICRSQRSADCQVCAWQRGLRCLHSLQVFHQLQELVTFLSTFAAGLFLYCSSCNFLIYALGRIHIHIFLAFLRHLFTSSLAAPLVDPIIFDRKDSAARSVILPAKTTGTVTNPIISLLGATGFHLVTGPSQPEFYSSAPFTEQKSRIYNANVNSS